MKNEFDEKVEQALPGYHEDAYGYGRWLRRMFPYAKSGLEDASDFAYCVEMLEQWEAQLKPVPSPSVKFRPRFKGDWEMLRELFEDFWLYS